MAAFQFRLPLMSLLVLGINHNTAPVAVREKVAFVPDVMHEALQQACARAGMTEVAILSTCNRTELFAVPDQTEAAQGDPAQAQAEQERNLQQQLQKLQQWLAEFHGLPLTQLEPSVYSHHD